MAAPMTCDNVAQWVEKIFAPTYIREESNYHFWCAQWWVHPEAVARLEALWLTWEAAIAHSSPYAMADWLRDYLDRLVPPLLAADGPFSSCSTAVHEAVSRGNLPVRKVRVRRRRPVRGGGGWWAW